MNWQDDPRLEIGIELQPVPSRGFYQTCLFRRPLPVYWEQCTLSEMTPDKEDHGLPDDVSIPFQGSRSSHLARRLLAHRSMPPVLFPMVKLVRVQLNFIGSSCLWQKSALPDADVASLALLTDEAFRTWYLIVACQVVAGHINRANDLLKWAEELVTALNRQPELPQKYRGRYQTIAERVADMRMLIPSLLVAIKAVVPGEVQQRLEAMAAAEATAVEARRIGQIRTSLDKAEHRFEYLGWNALGIVEASGLPSARPRITFAQFDFAAHFETSSETEPSPAPLQQKAKFCFDVDSYSRIPASDRVRSWPALYQNASLTGAAPYSESEEPVPPNEVLLTRNLVKYLRMPPAFFSLFRSMHVTLTLQLHTLVWPLQSKPDEVGHAGEHRTES